jgi:hypothetical protein
MTTLHDLMQAVNDLSYNELQQLRLHIDERVQQLKPAQGITPEDRIQRLEAAAAALREGLSEEQTAEITAAMNWGIKISSQ